MKPAVARKLAEAHSTEALLAAAEALADEREPTIDVDGADHGERLTHCLLAQRIREKTDAGATLKDAYREVMSGVRGVLTNE